MTTASMKELHRRAACGAAWDWCLPSAGVATLPAGAEGCFVRVEDGALWLTRTVTPRAAAHGARADDLWLEAGASLWLPPHSEWVVQAWPAARVRLLQAPPVRAAAAGGSHRVIEGRLAVLGAALRRRFSPGAALPAV